MPVRVLETNDLKNRFTRSYNSFLITFVFCEIDGKMKRMNLVRSVIRPDRFDKQKL